MKLEKEVFKRLCKTIGFLCEGSSECQDALRGMKLFQPIMSFLPLAMDNVSF
jgi:hypothetical protein